MPPRPKKGSEVDDEERQRQRLRHRAEGALVQAGAPSVPAHLALTPRYLRHSDGADIVKRNTSRKKRYLFLFPGGMSLTPGCKVGTLDGLSTKTPTLTVDCANGKGRMLFKGFLTFPKNGVILVKSSHMRKTKTKATKANTNAVVTVLECFDAIVSFAEWAWIGQSEGNPGNLPLPVPNELSCPPEATSDIWSQHRLRQLQMQTAKGDDNSSTSNASRLKGSASTSTPVRTASRATKTSKGSIIDVVSDDDEEPELVEDSSSDSVVITGQNGADNSDGEYKIKSSGDSPSGRRSLSTRKRKTVNYATLGADDEDDDDDDDDKEEEEEKDIKEKEKEKEKDKDMISDGVDEIQKVVKKQTAKKRKVSFSDDEYDDEDEGNNNDKPFMVISDDDDDDADFEG